MSTVPPSRPGAPPPPERPELPDGIAPPPGPPPRRPARGGIEFRPPARRPFRARDDAPPWPPWTAFAALVGAFALALVGGLVVAAVAAAFGASLEDPPPAVNIAATFVQDGAFIAVPLWLAWLVARRVTPGQLGLRPAPLWLAVGLSVVVAFAYLLLSGLWAALLDLSEPDQLPDSLGVDESTAALVVVCVLVTVVAPIAEEVLFRGFMLGALANWRGPAVAAVITGVLFGLIHAGSADAAFLVPLGLLGILLALLRWATGSLVPCIVLHAVNNCVAFGVNAADWGAWQIVLLIAGVNAVIALLLWPVVRRGGRAAAAGAAAGGSRDGGRVQ